VSSSRTCPFRLTTCMPPGTRHEPLFLPRPGPALSRPAAPNGWSGQLLYYRRSRSRSLAGHPPPPFGSAHGTEPGTPRQAHRTIVIHPTGRNRRRRRTCTGRRGGSVKESPSTDGHRGALVNPLTDPGPRRERRGPLLRSRDDAAPPPSGSATARAGGSLRPPCPRRPPTTRAESNRERER
jgi:hypothetical protein